MHDWGIRKRRSMGPHPNDCLHAPRNAAIHSQWQQQQQQGASYAAGRLLPPTCSSLHATALAPGRYSFTSTTTGSCKVKGQVGGQGRTRKQDQA